MIRLRSLFAALVSAAVLAAPFAVVSHAAEKKKGSAGRSSAKTKTKPKQPSGKTKPADQPKTADKEKKKTEPAKPAPAGTRALTEAEVKQKSAAAGAVMQQFIDARSSEARLPLVRNAEAVRGALETMHKALGDGDFALQHGRILGAAFGGADKHTLYFPYLLSTADAPAGFLVPVVETTDGFRVDWPAFSEGWQRPLQQWIAEPDRPEATFCAVVRRTHALDARAAAEGEGTVVLEVKQPEFLVNGDPPVLIAGSRSRSVKTAAELVEWNSERLVRVTLARRDDGWFDLRRIQPVPLPEVVASP